MLKQKEIEEIKKLIKSGFDLELISFELDVSIEQVKQCKLDIENSKKHNTILKIDTVSKRNNQAHLKINQMREKYKQLYFRSDKVEVDSSKLLSQEDLIRIRTVITTVQGEIEKIKIIPKNEKKNIANNILIELKKIKDFQLPIAEAEEIYKLMCSSELQGLNLSSTDKIDNYIKIQKNKIANQLVKAIEYEQYHVNDIEELQRLDRKLTGTIVSENPTLIGSLKMKILNRITSIRQQQIFNRIRTDISTRIVSVINDLVNGHIDINKAKVIIDEEVKKRVENKLKTKFTLTEEQERRQILIQIRTAIAEKTDTFNIQDPEKAVLQLQELCGGELELSIRPVVKNLIAKKDYETAKKICDKFSRRSKIEDIENENIKNIRCIRDEIRNAEISDIVMTAINMDGTLEEERAYIEFIEKCLKTGNIKLSAISLGKSKDGVKNITLADIWKDENEKSKSK